MENIDIQELSIEQVTSRYFSVSKCEIHNANGMYKVETIADTNTYFTVNAYKLYKGQWRCINHGLVAYAEPTADVLIQHLSHILKTARLFA